MIIGGIIAVVPALVLLALIIRQDNLEPEPCHLLLRALGLGFVAAFLALLGEFHVNMITLTDVFSSSWILLIDNYLNVAFIEEIFKWLVIFMMLYHLPDFDYRFDGIVYAVCVTIGFAIVENLFYVSLYGWTTGILRGFTSVMGHGIFGIVMGYLLGLAKSRHVKKQKYRLLLGLSILIPTLIHGTYDYLLALKNVKIFLVYIVVLDILALILVNFASVKDKSIYK